ncbi:MAG TPA: hypothetical protein VK530_04800 [Candidatus Acidoferrum sp.]|nr:hypothetical protein [Candidatus Acidoferrum sp.]
MKQVNNRSVSDDAMVIRIRRQSRARAIIQSGSLIDLGHEYDNQARQNFIREAALLAIIACAAVAWPAIHTLRILADSL